MSAENALVDSNEPKVILESKDGEKIDVPKKVIMMSGLIKDMLEEDAPDDDEDMEHKETPTIPIPNVEEKPLKKVIEYCQNHWNNKADPIEKPLKGRIEEVISEWDRRFLEIDQQLLIELIMAANYLNIKDLLDLTCAKVASMIKGKSPEQIRDMFGIKNDFTPEEEEKIREENKVCGDFFFLNYFTTPIY